jgi:hypothetical protein
VDVVAEHWDAAWAYNGAKKLRKWKFYAWRKRESYMARLVNSFNEKFGEPATQEPAAQEPAAQEPPTQEPPTPDPPTAKIPASEPPTILFGNASEKKGGFIPFKGGGVKGPVKELTRRLAKRYAVILCSEFRTTKLCHFCGRVLSHPTRHVSQGRYQAETTMHGLSYCPHRGPNSHQHMQGRDRMAAYNIGALFLATQLGEDLGPWQRGDTKALDDAAQAAGSCVLRQVLLGRGVNVFKHPSS